MNVFISYAHEQRPAAEEIAASLSARGYDVFFDRSRLEAGLEYDAAIQAAVGACDLFVFLLSPESIRQGTYSLTELGFARSRWKNPSGRVLPVMVKPTLNSRVDAYLRAVTILYPQGNLAAEVGARVSALLDHAAPETLDPRPSEQLQRERMAAYRGLWELTGLLPKWPRARGVGYEDLRQLSSSLRQWYFGKGRGMFLSRSAHSAYAALQDSLTAILIEQPEGAVTEEHYDVVRELCSALRSTISRDVGARA